MKASLLITAFFAACSFTLVSCNDDQAEKPSVLHGTSVVKEWEYGKKSYQYTEDIVAFGPRPVESAALEKTRVYIKDTLEKLGWSVQRQPFEADTPHGKKQMVNLYARYQGEASLEDVWKRTHKGVLCAHIDSKLMSKIEFLGAADAAASVGMVMEIAELLGKNFPKEAEGLELVFFDGEEALDPNIKYGQKGVAQDGLYGSYYYAKNRNRKRNFGVLLDLLGVEGNITKLPVENNGVEKLYLKVMEIARQQGVNKKFKKSGSIIDDHIPLNEFGCPTIDIIGDFSSNEWWHTSKDNMDIISEQKLGETLKVVFDLVVGELRK